MKRCAAAEELQFIERLPGYRGARFGKDNLDIVKQIDDAAWEVFVPSMLLSSPWSRIA